MNTEITDIEKFEGWVLYDAHCSYCTALAKRTEAGLAARHFKLLPLQTPWVRERLALTEAELLAEMKLLKPDGKVLGGMDAILEIGRHYRLVQAFCLIGKIPIVTKCLRRAYRWIAIRRNCAGGACEIKNPTVTQKNWWFVDYLPLVILPTLVLTFQNQLAPWIFMWAMAFAIYTGCKWLTYRKSAKPGKRPSLKFVLGYLLAWPGMDATGFLNRELIPVKPRAIEWWFATIKIGLGLILLGVLARRFVPEHPLLGGWVGMIGIIFLIHFGLFHVCSLVWRQTGVEATLVMRNPLRAQSLIEFWGERWNTAYNELVFRFTYRPLRKLTTPTLAILLVFGLSGFIHELVISLPAHAGYGLPTFYFLIQGLGVVIERTRFGKSIGLGQGARGWLFTALVTVGPAFSLFHPPFINNVILPMLTAIGAT